MVCRGTRSCMVHQREFRASIWWRSRSHNKHCRVVPYAGLFASRDQGLGCLLTVPRRTAVPFWSAAILQQH